MNRNNFNKKVQMHLACSTDGLRPQMECVYFKNGFAYATNGAILVRNRISEISGLEEREIEALDGKSLHANFYKDMLKYDNIMIAADGIECIKGDDKSFFYFSTTSNQFPNADRVLQDSLNKPAVPMSQVSFDMRLMQRLNKALYKGDRCAATFKGAGNPIVFDSIEEEVSSVGLMMLLTQTDD